MNNETISCVDCGTIFESSTELELKTKNCPKCVEKSQDQMLRIMFGRSLRGLTMYASEELPIQLREESVISEEFDLDSLIAQLDLMTEPEESTSGFDEIKRDVEGYLRIKGLTLKEFIKKVRISGGEDL
jgi:hypothetical protein